MGLRNGDKVTGYSIPKGVDPDQVVTIETADKVFSFRPEHPEKRLVYQFKTNLSPEDKLKIRQFFGA